MTKTSRVFPALGFLSFVLTPLTVEAAMYYNDVYTDASGNFPSPNAGWSGDGTVQGPVGAFPATVSYFDVDLVTGLSGGTLSLGKTRSFIGGNGMNTGIMGTMDVTVGGGTADLRLDSFWGTLGFGPNNFGFYDFKDGASSLVVEFNWSEPIAAVQGGSGAPSSAAPFLAAMAAFGAGSTYDISSQYLGLVSSTNGTTWGQGLPAGASAVDMTASNYSWANGSTTASASGVALPNGAWQGVNGFDLSGGAHTSGLQNNGTFEDDELVYATGLRFTLERSDGAAFGSGTEFIFSTNGNQWDETIEGAMSVPEPSRTALLGLALGFVLLKRKRC